MKTCQSCGAANNLDSKFCYACGVQFVNQVNGPLVQPINVNQSSTPPPPGPTQPPSYMNVPSFSNQPNLQNQAPQMQYGNVPAGSLYVDPPKSSSTNWVLVSIGGILIVALLAIVVLFTPLLNIFNLGNNAAEEFVNYYNNVHVPIYKYERDVIQQLDSSLFSATEIDLYYIYESTFNWANTIQDVYTQYRNASVPNNELIQLNNLSIQRTSTLHNAIYSLQKAIELDNADMYNNDFIGGIKEYSALQQQWENLKNQLMQKYDVSYK